MFAYREVRLGVGVAVTDRHGGVSAPPFAELNLADHVGDDPDAVAVNRERVRAAVGDWPLVAMRQVHSAHVVVVDEVPPQPPEADAVVTARAGLTLVVLVADCTPILLADDTGGVVAAVHAGRRGLASGIVSAAIAAMRDLGARPDRMRAVVGPSICAEHYDVPADMRDAVDAAAPGSAATTSSGAPALDIRAGLLRQLHEIGVRRSQVLAQCTVEEAGCYSYRRDGTTGRFAGLVWREP